jgi:hypothetical protein
MSNDHMNYKRPEITRSFETLAKDQREIIDEQRKKNELKIKIRNADFIGLINSKIYSYAELSADNCIKQCHKNKSLDINTITDSNEPVFSFYLESSRKKELMKQEINMKCYDNCVNKKMESYKMLINVN